jgi:hypothetical protein
MVKINLENFKNNPAVVHAVIPATQEPEGGDDLSPGVQYQSGQHSKTLPQKTNNNNF